MIIVAIIISSVAMLAQMVDRDTKKVTVRTQSMNGVPKGAFPNFAYNLAIIRMFNKISLIHCIPTVGNMFFPIRARPGRFGSYVCVAMQTQRFYCWTSRVGCVVCVCCALPNVYILMGTLDECLCSWLERRQLRELFTKVA